ncbi:MAG: glycosyltransferase family 4 protein [Ilumatobacter sp.]|nr:glycosyltransferase family 4 protein [Ilumatobacter sp.]
MGRVGDESGVETGPRPVRVAYTVEQCWDSSPGGTAVAALRIAHELAALSDDVDVRLVAGKHLRVPDKPYRPAGTVAMLPLARPLLYETWVRWNWPKVESATGAVDVAHATGLIPCGTAAPLVVTLHDVAFLHSPQQFTAHGVRIMTKALDVIRDRTDRVLVPSAATLGDCLEAGIAADRLRVVPLGVDVEPASPSSIERVVRRYELPDEFVLFVGTLQPRKNLARLVAAMAARRSTQALVVVGAQGWGDDVDVARSDVDVRFLGFVPDDDLGPIYAAAGVFAYPSEREGFGLPVAEAMAQATPVVTSAGTSTEEVAGGAAVLVDPFDVRSIADGIDAAFDQRVELAARSVARVRELSWASAARRTLDVYRELADGGGPAAAQ